MKLVYTGILLALVLSSFAQVAKSAVALAQEAEVQPNALSQIKPNNSYGDWLFKGNFNKVGFSGFNPDYHLSIGDKVLVQLWGALDYQGELVVDVHGNIFIPKVGPVLVKGVKNSQLNDVVKKSIKRVYKSNVEVYANLATSEQVKVFVSGTVSKPGLYQGHSADSILTFIDQAGGIRSDIGSYRNIQIKRNNKVLNTFDLYGFLTQGKLLNTQFQDGDLIFVAPKLAEVNIEGQVGFTGKYELKQGVNFLEDILKSVAIEEKATHVTLVTPIGREVVASQYSVSDLANVEVQPGTLIKVSSQLRAKSISVTVMGEHNSQQELVLPWGATLTQLTEQIIFTPLSNRQAMQLFRPAVAERQKAMLLESLTALEQSVLTARSQTNEAAQLRSKEAETILTWIDKAKKVQPNGQVLLSHLNSSHPIYLQQGDKVVIPAKRNIVMVHGEVLFPTAIAYQTGLSAKDFIEQAGGAMLDMDDVNVLVMKPNGSVITVNKKLSKHKVITAGDEIFVLAKPDEKSFQLTKDITQVMYQIAASAAVILAI
ncbi:polysaccharide biosynthesis/export family protein [uncultured Paraglaciecola sp.]|uniref:polysaccharide biosynthesis/export family protein n=1 Tax=uncultured Paraglaciecola sp. TaxID=1765024 RepID=UPI0030DBFCD0|tara:strand:- start:44775 stop:46397 length:1623 start_codon:yes stop_codon:yes gene_type:complete